MSSSACVLAIDVTSENGSIALADATGVKEEVALHSTDGFEHFLFEEIRVLLARHQVELKQLAAIAVASGPGTFTGVRVGMTAAMGLAEGAGVKVIAVSNLMAMAGAGSKPLRGVLIDARRGEIYGAVYDARLKVVREEAVMPLETWKVQLPEGEIEIITNMPGVEGAVPAARCLAGAVARIAIAHPDWAKDPVDVDANYVRRNDAQMFWTDTAKS